MPLQNDPHGCNNPDHAGLRRILTTDVVVGDDTLGQDVAALHLIIHGLREHNTELRRIVRRHNFQGGVNWFGLAMGVAGIVAVLFTFFGR